MDEVLTEQDSVEAVRATNEALIDSIQGFKDSISILLENDNKKEVVVIQETNYELKKLTDGNGQALDSTIQQIKQDLLK